MNKYLVVVFYNDNVMIYTIMETSKKNAMINYQKGTYIGSFSSEMIEGDGVVAIELNNDNMFMTSVQLLLKNSIMNCAKETILN